MKTRKLGWTDLNLSTVGLGTFAIGGAGWPASWGPQNDKDSTYTISLALEQGVNWIDTAPVYGFGHSEEVVGKALESLGGNRPIISTKCGLVWDEKGGIVNCLRRGSVRSEVEASLKRLGVDVIDLYHIHWPIPDEDIEEGWDAIAQVIKEGKIRYAAASNFDVQQIKRVQSIHPVAAIQNPYSMVERDIEKEVLGYCRDNNIGVVVWGPMAHGLLTGKFDKKRVDNLHAEDHFRRQSPHFNEPEASINIRLVKSLYPIAQMVGLTLAQLAIAWVLRRAEVTSAIVGARVPSQIKETVRAAECVLSQKDISDIDRLLDTRQQELAAASETE